jgi:O-antigen/teichoic acid export membrane protein
MGIVYKKTIKGTIVLYIGIVIGFINTGLIFPKVLTTEQIGLLNILISYSQVLSLFGNLGFSNTILKFFPYFKNSKTGHNGFLKVIILVSFLGFLLSLFLFFVLKQFIISSNSQGSSLFYEYIYLIIPLTFFTIYFNAFDTYYRALFNSVSGIFYKEFLTRVLVLLSVLLYLFDIFDFKTFVLAYAGIYSLPALGIIISIFIGKELRIIHAAVKLKKGLKRAMIRVSLYSFLPGLSGVLLVNLDKLMIERFLGLSELGVYSIAFFFGTLVAIPSRSLIRISTSFIAEAWKKKDLNKISEIYSKSSINQLVIGSLLLIGIWGNIDNILKILPEQYHMANYIILIISFSFLTDMAAGTAIQIISLSKYYRYQTYFMVVFIILTFVLNFILIPKYGIYGAAISAFLSKFLFNCIRIIFIWQKFKLWPFNLKYFYTIIFALIAYLASRFMPNQNNLYFDIFWRSTIISVVFALLIISFNVSVEINEKIHNIYLFLKKKVLKL